MDEADDTDEDWEDSASYFPSTASLPSFPALPLPSLSSLPATLSSASSSLSVLLSSLPSLSSIPPSDLRQLQSTLQSLLSDSLENVVHHAKLFARVGGDWWQGRERDKERHSKLEGQRRRQKDDRDGAASREEDKEMAEYVAFLTQLVQATGSDWEVVREERDEAAVLSGQRLTVVEEHFGPWDERERRMVDRIREELKAAKRKELELTAATDSTTVPAPHSDEKESMHENGERDQHLRSTPGPSRHDAASDTSELPSPYARPSAGDAPPRHSVSTSVDTADLHMHRPLSSAAVAGADVNPIPRRPSSSSTIRPFEPSMHRSPRVIASMPTVSPHSPWLSQGAPTLQPLSIASTSYSLSPLPQHRPLEASGYWNTHTQLFIPSSQHAALVSYQAPTAPPLHFPPALSRPASRTAFSVVSPGVTLPFTPLAAVVASLVSADNNSVASTNDSSPLVVSESLLSPSQSSFQSATASATPVLATSTTAGPTSVSDAVQPTNSFVSASPAASSVHRPVSPLPTTSFAASSPTVQPPHTPSDLTAPHPTPSTSLPSVPPSSVPAANEIPLAQSAPTAAPAPSAPSSSTIESSPDAPPAPPMDDVPVAPPMMDDGVPVAPPFDPSIPPPPPMSSPASPAAALPPPLALSSSTPSSAKRSSMKRLHWSKLRYENVQQSVWSQLLQSASTDSPQHDGLTVDVEAMKQLIDVSELEDKFTSTGAAQKDGSTGDRSNNRPAAKTDAQAVGGNKKGQAAVEDERRAAVISTRNTVSQFTAVDTLRAYNVEIAFSQLKTTADSIKQALLLDGWQMDEAAISTYLNCVQQFVSPSADAIAIDGPAIATLPVSPLSLPLSADQLDILSRIVPSDEEAARTTAAPPSATPGTVEQFFRAMCSTPRIRRRVELLAFLCNAPTELLSINASFASLHLAHTAILSSPSLRRFLALVLLVGNTLNAGTSQGNAYGFRLSWLSEMAQVKTRDGKETMMEFIVRTAEKPTATSTPTSTSSPPLSLLSELHCVPAAAAIDTQSLAASLTSLRSLTALAAREASLLPANDALHRLLTVWVAGWQRSVKAVEASYEQMLVEGKELCRYLAEDESRGEGAITVVRDVLLLYSKAKDESERKQREQREKLKAKEREKEKEDRRQLHRKPNNDTPSIPTATLLSCTSRVAQQTGPRRRKFVRSQLREDALDDEAGITGLPTVAALSPSCSPSTSPSSTSLSSLHQSDSCSSLQFSLTSMSSSLSSHSPAS